MADLSVDELEQLQHDLEGTCKSLTELIESYRLEIREDELEDRLLDGNHPVERSVCCQWWFTPGELEFDCARNGGVCASCEPEAHET